MDSTTRPPYIYDDYTIYDYDYLNGRHPPLIKKTSRIIDCVVRNDVEGLALLLDSPEWYRVAVTSCDSSDGTIPILGIAMLEKCKQVFDYLLSLKDFPVDDFIHYAENIFSSDRGRKLTYYIHEVIRRICILNARGRKGYTLLHMCIDVGYSEITKLLIEKGADINALNDYGHTPLHWTVVRWPRSCIRFEEIAILLTYGADPSICCNKGLDFFDYFMEKFTNHHDDDDSDAAAEIVFYYTFDSYTSREVDLSVLLKLAHCKSPLFHRVLESASEIVYYEDRASYSDTDLLSVESQYLQTLIEKCDDAVEIWLVGRQISEDTILRSLTNIDLLMNSKFKYLVMEIICNMDSRLVIHRLINDRSHATERLWYLLSYGMVLTARDLELVYKYLGHDELFAILLHMDVNLCDTRECGIIPALYYNMNIHLETFLENPKKFAKFGVEELLYYSAHPKLKQICYELRHDLIERAEALPRIPLLTELARNVFRKYFIEKFQITTSRQFYTKIRALDVPPGYKDIITFQQKLYN